MSLVVRRILGFVFLLVAVLLTLAILGRFQDLLGTLIGFLAMLRGNLDADKAGTITGELIYWIAHFTATFYLWKYGVRWTSKKQADSK